DLLAESAVDVLAIDRDLDVLLARADVADLDSLGELGRRLGGGRRLAVLVLMRGRGGFFRGCFVSHEFLLSFAAINGTSACLRHRDHCILGVGGQEKSPWRWRLNYQPTAPARDGWQQGLSVQRAGGYQPALMSR